MRWSQITECGPVRRRNEDWLCACPELGLFAVADGMGGHRAGNVASRLALEILEEYVRHNSGRGYSDRELLAGGIQRANEAVYRSAAGHEEHRGMGTTINACLLKGNKLTLANVGDSRALLLRNKKISKLTSDHSLVQELVDGGSITEEDAMNHPKRNVLTRALGIGPRVEVDFFEYNIMQGDCLLLCTDGLTGFVAEDRIGELILASPDPEAVVRNLYAEAINAGSNDNITMIFLAVD
ncbi:Stp1/IreP family PP2C-type Ser/Thr phosphatase [Desulfallas sp. Bu1-1]|jgi:protein phosphatase|uniref:Stp1/IreP family PP2C-type Ser/Thr phosphatase n=1 Tax=Desulfallas sp. Bu1-1 TaxID=2787620 RepID=UPI00189D3B78|nr:Stp1/IreP family PP2C-type Ser/Thr phosphatase [Desulfallas sp. Bu1-1]MBF7082334.1 Stp1/IreP family PP2C-type Ser/Thr phosphatase [Desulfallas sp. Bu1-1]